MKLYVFTKKDIDRFLIECNFTPDEERLFRLRCKEYTLEYCAEQMNVSISTAKRLSRRVNNKIIKVCRYDKSPGINFQGLYFGIDKYNNL